MTYDAYAPRVVPPQAIKAAAKAVAAEAAGSTIKGKDSRQIEAFSDRETGAADVQNVAASELRQFIERIERLEEEKAALAGDIKDIFGEAKGRGYDTKAIRTILKMRRQDRDERMEEEAILETYLAALGMIDGPADAS